MALYHFSEDPNITLFEPHRAPSSVVDEPLVWAIDGWHQVMYFFPRDCPRTCFWPGEHTTPADLVRFFGTVGARMIIAIEASWLRRVRTTTLYRYTMPDASFAPRDATAGHWISREPVVPSSVEAVEDLLGAIIDANVELRITPSLIALWRDVISSTLEFSGTRLRNAQGSSGVDWSAVKLGPHAQPPP